MCLLFLLFFPSFSILLSSSPKPFLLFSRLLPSPPLASFILPHPPFVSVPSFLHRLTVHDVLPLESIHLCLFCSAFSPLLTLLLRHPSIPPSLPPHFVQTGIQAGQQLPGNRRDAHWLHLRHSRCLLLRVNCCDVPLVTHWGEGYGGRHGALIIFLGWPFFAWVPPGEVTRGTSHWLSRQHHRPMPAVVFLKHSSIPLMWQILLKAHKE